MAANMKMTVMWDVVLCSLVIATSVITMINWVSPVKGHSVPCLISWFSLLFSPAGQDGAHPLSHWLPCSFCPHQTLYIFPIGLAKVSLFSTQFLWCSLLITLMIQTASTSQTSGNFCQTTQRNIPEEHFQKNVSALVCLGIGTLGMHWGFSMFRGPKNMGGKIVPLHLIIYTNNWLSSYNCHYEYNCMQQMSNLIYILHIFFYYFNFLKITFFSSRGPKILQHLWPSTDINVPLCFCRVSHIRFLKINKQARFHCIYKLVNTESTLRRFTSRLRLAYRHTTYIRPSFGHKILLARKQNSNCK
jgi:hypothetical protein